MIKFFIVMMLPEALVVFAKLPNPQKTKTRLSPPLSRSEAASLYACFLVDTLTAVAQVDDVERIIGFDPPTEEASFARLAPGFRLLPQRGGDLGLRMHHAFADLFAQGYQRVILVGSDLPHLSPLAIRQGFEYLRQGADVVLGPSADGGYYLVGLPRLQPQLFDLPMSTPSVFRQTLERAERLRLQVARLSETFDVDSASDLERLKALLLADSSIPAASTRAWLAEF